MKKWILLLSVVMLCVVVFAGCGNDSNEPENTNNNEKNQEETEEKENKNEDENDENDEKKPDVNEDEDQDKEKDEEEYADIPERAVYLTFDDGPTAATLDILDTLKQHNVKATFFMLEPSMRNNPETVKRIVEEGHSVALHGVTHVKGSFYHSPQSALDEMKTAKNTLQEITGVESYLIRTPYGSVPYLTEDYRKVLNDAGFKLWDWNVDTNDWALSGDAFVNHTIKQIENIKKDTPVVLMHDKKDTAAHLHKLLNYLKDNGYKPIKIEENMEPHAFECLQRCYQFN